LASVVLFVCANDVLINNTGNNGLSSSDGLLLLCFFLIFLSYTFAIAKNNTGNDEEIRIKDMPIWRASLYITGGLASLIYGGQLFVDGASGIARGLGVDESIIALTLVAGGTSLPELATSVAAALKKNPEMAIGNVIGSNLFNIFFILGCSATIVPMDVRGITNLDFGVLILSCILLYTFGLLFKKRTITRIEGGIMLLCYVTYIIYLIHTTA
jgi:cation:H+ antiporter